jgi:peptidoglycan/LPS O-acetylase OafA/YrhL
MLRSIGAVAAGYFVFVVSAVLIFQLSGHDPHADAPIAFEIAILVWGAVFAMVGGWLAAHVSVRRPATHAAVVALVIALGATVSMLTAGGARWSQAAALVVMAPCAWLGGALASRQKARDP